MDKKDLVFPDYNNSILNLITSIIKNYGVGSEHTTLPKVDEYLRHKYNNVVLLVMDGMGDKIFSEIPAENLKS